MVVQHLVVILLILWKEVSSSPSNLPPCLESSSCFYSGCLLTLSSVCPGHYSSDMGCAGVAASSCSPEGLHSVSGDCLEPPRTAGSVLAAAHRFPSRGSCLYPLPGASVGSVLFLESTHEGKKLLGWSCLPSCPPPPLPRNKGTWVLCAGTDPFWLHLHWNTAASSACLCAANMSPFPGSHLQG